MSPLIIILPSSSREKSLSIIIDSLELSEIAIEEMEVGDCESSLTMGSCSMTGGVI